MLLPDEILVRGEMVKKFTIVITVNQLISEKVAENVKKNFGGFEKSSIFAASNGENRELFERM